HTQAPCTPGAKRSSRSSIARSSSAGSVGGAGRSGRLWSLSFIAILLESPRCRSCVGSRSEDVQAAAAALARRRRGSALHLALHEAFLQVLDHEVVSWIRGHRGFGWIVDLGHVSSPLVG